MTYVLVDANNMVRNFVEWDGSTVYDPTPFIIKPYKAGLEMGADYDAALLNVDLDLGVAKVGVSIKP